MAKPLSFQLSRRSLLGGLGGVALLSAVAACGDSDSAGSGPSGAGSSAAAAAFPVAIEHRFGSTTIPERPARVVALGGGDMEAAIALGLVPVGGADWFGYDAEVRPWVAAALGEAEPPVLLQSYEPSYEKIAALAPDLILYVNTTNDEAVYRTLAKIAPTVAGPADVVNSYGVAWRDQLDLVATATGLQAEAEQVKADVSAKIDAAIAAHPEFAGKTITAGVFSPDQMSAWMPSDPRMQLLTELGFEPNPDIAALDEGDFFIAISPERIDLMEADTVFIAALDEDGNVAADLEKNKLFQGLDSVSSGRVGYFPGPPTILSSTPAGNFSSAFSIGGALGIPACLDELTATLATAVAGDGPAKAAF